MLLSVSAFLWGRDAGEDDKGGTATAISEQEVSGINSWTELNSGQVRMTVNNRGLFGAHYIGSPVCGDHDCANFISPADSNVEYLFAGAIWIGAIKNNDTLVTISADGWSSVTNEFYPSDTGRYFDFVSDEAYYSIMTDTVVNEAEGYLNPLGLLITHSAHIWNNEPENMGVVHDIVITNISDDYIHDGYAGFYMDVDVHHSSNSSGCTDDVAGSLYDNGTGFIMDWDGDPSRSGDGWDYASARRAFAFKFLQTSMAEYDTSFNWWFSNSDKYCDFGPQKYDEYGELPCVFADSNYGTPVSDADKYCIMSHQSWDYDQFHLGDPPEGWLLPGECNPDFAYGFDTRMLMSVGPFNLEPDSSVRIIFTTFTGRDIHVDPENFENNFQYNDPQAYLDNLDFSDLINNSLVFDSLGGLFLDPDNPVTGLQAFRISPDSAEIQWAPFVFDEIAGYNIYLEEIPDELFPYPGVIPPWLSNDDFPNMTVAAETGLTYQHYLNSLDPDKFYFASVANKTASGAGEMGAGVPIEPWQYIGIPEVIDTFIYFAPGESITLNWHPVEDVPVDHYNIYKFADQEQAAGIYHAFYSTENDKNGLEPVDSFYVDDVWYFYFAVDLYASVSGVDTSFIEFATDGSSYVISAVTANGCEIGFSNVVQAFESEILARDVVVLHCRNNSLTADRVVCDSIVDFYDRILTELDLDFELYSFADTFTAYGDLCKPEWWRDLLPFKMVIIDGGLWQYYPLNDGNYDCVQSTDFIQYLQAGGRIFHCGLCGDYAGNLSSQAPSYYYFGGDGPDYYDYFGVDEALGTGMLYYFGSENYPADTLLGIIEAESQVCGWPDVRHESHLGETATLSVLWDSTTMIIPSIYSPDEKGEIIQRAVSKYSETSFADGEPIGIKTVTDNAVTYLFGYHLWYLNETDALRLVSAAFYDNQPYRLGGPFIDPESLDIYWAQSTDPITGNINLVVCPDGYSVDDIDQESISINGAIEPSNITVAYDMSGENGDTLILETDLVEFLNSYSDVTDGEEIRYAVSGQFTTGEDFTAFGRAVMGNYLTGDANGTGEVNIADASYLINYVFYSGAPPVSMEASDVNGDGRVNIADASYLVCYIFFDCELPYGSE